jgi:hypothetical protein
MVSLNWGCNISDLFSKSTGKATTFFAKYLKIVVSKPKNPIFDKKNTP